MNNPLSFEQARDMFGYQSFYCDMCVILLKLDILHKDNYWYDSPKDCDFSDDDKIKDKFNLMSDGFIY